MLRYKQFLSYKTVINGVQQATHTAAKTTQKNHRQHFKLLDGAVDNTCQHFWERRTNSRLLAKKFRHLLESCQNGGGEKAVKRHTEVNKKLLVRKRLHLLLDDMESFLEIGPTVGMNMEYGDVPAAASITGIGKISGRWCMVTASDATVKGGTVYPIGVKKQLRAQEIAEELRLPSINLIDSGGAFLPLQAEIFPGKEHGGRTFYNQAIMNSLGIPQITMVCGSCTAGAAYLPCMSCDVVIVDKIGTIFLGGPPLVKAATGEVVTPEELGGATLHTQLSGYADHFAADESEGIAIVRDSVLSLGEMVSSSERQWEDPLYSQEDLEGLAPSNDTGFVDMDKILARILDGSRYHPFKKSYDPQLITAFGYIQGHLVGVIANNGELTGKGSMQGSHFIQLCAQRDIPLIFLQNVTSKASSLISTGHFQGDLLRGYASMMKAVANANIPKITVTVGSNVGAHSFPMCGRSFSPNFMFSWPNSKTAIVDESSLSHLGLKSDEENDTRERLKTESSSFYAASRLWIDDIILPASTRKVLAHCLDIINDQRRQTKANDMMNAVYRF